MSTIRGPLSRYLDASEDHAAIDRGVARLKASPRRPRRTRAWLAVSGVAAVAAAVALAIARTPGPSELELASGAPLVAIEARNAGQIVELSDGTRIELARGARIERLENDASRLVLRQEVGRVRYEVAPQGPRRFTIEAGLAAIEVIGTAFVIDRTTAGGLERVAIHVEHGVVIVRGDRVPDGVVRLEDGARLIVGAEPHANVRTPSETAAPVTIEEAVPVAVAPVPRERPARTSEPRTQGPGEVSAAEDDRPDDAELLARADSLRGAGRRDEAQALLEMVAARGRAPHAALASFSLARLLETSDPAGAERAFERALELGLPAALHGSAWAHLAGLQGARGDLDRARESAERAIAGGATGADLARAQRWR